MKTRSVVTEFGVFCLIMGIGIAAVGLALRSNMPRNAPPLLGIERGKAIGVPIVVIGLLHVAAGVATLWKRSKLAIGAGMFASFLIPLFYVGLMIAASGNLGVNCMSVLIIALPFIVFSRGRIALRELDSTGRH